VLNVASVAVWELLFAKLAEKQRDGALVRKRYHKPATPCQRLLDDVRLQVGSMYASRSLSK
jgi:hypothetical protein